MSSARTVNPAAAGSPWRLVMLCLFVAIVEGVDIQSVGVAAAGLARSFDLSATALGIVMSASIVGLMVGAALGGWASDWVGRKPVLIAAMAVLGVFTLATVVVPDVSFLVAARFFAGIGLGGAFPTLIALISEAMPERHRGIGLGAMYCGLPIGGAVAALTMASRPAADWPAVFHVGGWIPLLLVPVLAVALPADRRNLTAAAPDRCGANSTTGGLLGVPSTSTLLLWVSFFFTLLVVYTLLNWLPSLLVARGIARDDALFLSMTMNLGAAAGGLATGLAVDTWRLGRVVAVAYAGMVAALAALVIASGPALYGATFTVGFFVIGGQLILYAIAPRLYPAASRGRGVGAAITIGRAGSIAGPALAGALLGAGFDARAIPLVLAGGLIVAVLAAATLVRAPLLARPR